MNNYTNIYDIDGNIIRKAGDNHRFTIEEVEKLVDDLTAKVQQNPDNQVYKVYLNNAHKWLYNMYNNMSVEELTKRISTIQDAIQAAKDNATEQEQRPPNEYSHDRSAYIIPEKAVIRIIKLIRSRGVQYVFVKCVKSKFRTIPIAKKPFWNIRLNKII